MCNKRRTQAHVWIHTHTANQAMPQRMQNPLGQQRSKTRRTYFDVGACCLLVLLPPSLGGTPTPTLAACVTSLLVSSALRLVPLNQPCEQGTAAAAAAAVAAAFSRREPRRQPAGGRMCVAPACRGRLRGGGRQDAAPSGHRDTLVRRCEMPKIPPDPTRVCVCAIPPVQPQPHAHALARLPRRQPREHPRTLMPWPVSLALSSVV